MVVSYQLRGFPKPKSVACNNTQKYAETPKQKPQAKTRRRVYGEAFIYQIYLTEPQGKIKNLQQRRRRI